MHEDVVLANQLKRMQGWKNPIVDSAAATVLWRRRYFDPGPFVPGGDGRVRGNTIYYPDHTTQPVPSARERKAMAWKYEFLVTERLRGAAKGHHQAHHGGIIDPTDKNTRAAAVREVKEETGFIIKPKGFLHVAQFGPELYRSTAKKGKKHSQEVVLTITDTQAEPGVPFILELFIAEVSEKTPQVDVDHEVKVVGWFTLEELLERYGSSKTFNYWSFFLHAAAQIIKLHRSVEESWIGEFDPLEQFPDSSPGTYQYNVGSRHHNTD